MTTVAQHYQPRRLIAVGNRQLRSTARRSFARHDTRQPISTFPSLVGSLLSRLEVGNRQRFCAPHHTAPRHITVYRFSYQRITLPSVVGLRAECGGYLLPQLPTPKRVTTFRNSSSCISTNTCQASVAFGQLAVRRNHVAPPHSAARRASPPCPASQRTDPPHHMRRPHGLRKHA